jgi:hypothetical protein
MATIQDWHCKQGEDPSLNDMLLDNILVDLVLNGLAMLISFRLDHNRRFRPAPETSASNSLREHRSIDIDV